MFVPLAARLLEAWLGGSFASGQLVFALWSLASAVLAIGTYRWARGEVEDRWRPTTRRGARLLALAFGLLLILTGRVALGGNVGPSVLGSLAEWTLGLAGALLVRGGLDGLSTPTHEALRSCPPGGLPPGMARRAAILVVAVGLLGAGWLAFLGAAPGAADREPPPDGTVPLEASGTAEAPDDGVVLEWELTDCEFTNGFASTTVERLAPYMPDGFEPAGAVLLPALSELPDAPAVLGFDVTVCASGSGAAGTVAPMVYTAFWAAVHPPEGDPAPEGAFHYVTWDPLIPDQPRRELFLQAGIPAHDGTANITWDGPEALASGGVTEYTVDGLGTFTFNFATVQEPRSLSGTLVFWTGAVDGDIARSQINYTQDVRGQGLGTIQVPPDSWVADVLGSDVVPARFATGHWDLVDGQIQLPG